MWIEPSVTNPAPLASSATTLPHSTITRSRIKDGRERAISKSGSYSVALKQAPCTQPTSLQSEGVRTSPSRPGQAPAAGVVGPSYFVAGRVWTQAPVQGGVGPSAMSHTRANDREQDNAIDLSQLQRTLRASIAPMKRSRREILRPRRRQKDIAALERVEVQIRDTRAPSKSRRRPATGPAP